MIEMSSQIDDFKKYLSSEFQVDSATAIELKFTHNLSIKIDKKTKLPINVHAITACIRFFDKDMNLLTSANVKFINNELSKQCEKKLVNIAPKELSNKFMAARPAIIASILAEYTDKLADVKSKIHDLNTYAGKENDSPAINDQFKGELVQVATDNAQPSAKKTFEM